MLLKSAARIESHQATEASVALAKAFLAAAAAAATRAAASRLSNSSQRSGDVLKGQAWHLSKWKHRQRERERRDPT